MSDKHPIELNVEIKFQNNSETEKLTRLQKMVEANFVPQHGMEILIDGILFKVKTIALAGLSGLKHVAFPLSDRNSTFVNRSAFNNRSANLSENTSKVLNQYNSAVEAFRKNGWKEIKNGN